VLLIGGIIAAFRQRFHLCQCPNLASHLSPPDRKGREKKLGGMSHPPQTRSVERKLGEMSHPHQTPRRS
jgi:hypothetical protein